MMDEQRQLLEQIERFDYPLGGKVEMFLDQLHDTFFGDLMGAVAEDHQRNRFGGR